MIAAGSFMPRLQEALEASWDRQTAYGAVEQVGNPALGQCYPTCQVVQHYYPTTEIAKGNVWTGDKEELHFWNVLIIGNEWYHIDLSWQQFPVGSTIRGYVLLDRNNLGDSEATLQRCALLLKRVGGYLRTGTRDAGEVTVRRSLSLANLACPLRDADGSVLGSPKP